ncbi:ABI family, member 3 (NESH) binding protein b isoform X6 [Coregonus clupeaformis]|uniref:ABI family, member 3 (NESH) binding protein b isoform X6 n=1 Tax=Coregonus clupeaformis TaxID=59861 RepID=UPI001E1C88FE|nr:ABI family, member 3 (NESH) binding protein b isoform X6 [Coregonus clupeaformis]
MAGTMLLRVSLLLLAGSILLSCIPAQRIRVRRQNMKVRINATGDTIVMKFVRPNPDTKLEGYILGYGSSMFSKQFIQLPENGEPYETEIDAEPKYLVAVQPIPSNDVKKQCTGKVNLEKPLHLVIGSITPTSVLLSWGTFLKTPYDVGNIMNDCLEDGHYTVRYRERNRKWIYQTCPTSDTVIDNLKPNTPYEFGVRSNKDESSGVWSKPVIHKTNMGAGLDKIIQKPYKHRTLIAKPMKPPMSRALFPPRPAIHNRTQPRIPPLTKNQGFPGAPKTSFAPPESHLEARPDPRSNEPQWPQFPLDGGNSIRNASSHLVDLPPASPQLLPTKTPSTSSATPVPNNPSPHGEKQQGKTQPRGPTSATEKPHNPSSGQDSQRNLKPHGPAITLIARTMKSPAARNPLFPFTDGSRQDTPSSSSSSSNSSTSSSSSSSLLRRANNSSQTSGTPGGQDRQRNLKPHGPAFTLIARTMKSPAARNPLFPFTDGSRQDTPSSSSSSSTSSSSSSSTSSSSSSSLLRRANNSSQTSGTPGANGKHHKGPGLPKPVVWNRLRMANTNNSLLEDINPGVSGRSGFFSIEDQFYGSRPSIPVNKKTNLVGKPGDMDKLNVLKQTDKASILKKFPSVTSKPAKQERRHTTTTAPSVNDIWFETWVNSSLFSSLPASDVDALGKKRFVAPHVVYKTDKKPDEPCSITSSLNYFPEEEGGQTNVTAPPKSPPSNLTVVTVEGCPSFIILDWEKTDNDTTEYEVISTTKGPDGTQVSILTTNQTHTAVENLKPESSYEFKVKPKNELGAGPPSEPVSFNTESADPRVSENVSGKDAIWTQFPFKTDSYSECNGKQYVKRTWYRKFVGIQLCNSLRYKIYLSDSLNGKFYNIGDQTGHGEDHCQFVDSFLDGRTGNQVMADQLPAREGYYRAMRQEPVNFGQIGRNSHVTYVSWYECGTPIPGKW